MGSVLQGRCDCGYASSEIFAGGGFDAGRSNLPARCDHCREIITVDTAKARLRCSRCGRKPAEVYNVFSGVDSLDEAMPAVAFPCPRCQEVTLRFDLVGIWD